MLAEALTLVDKTGERFYEAELYRLKGELSLQAAGRNPQLPAPNTQHVSRGVFSQSHRNHPAATGKVAGAASSDKP